jgi:CheY-like chemotaxis protein
VEFETFAPDLVFMDLSMPGIDGFEAAASIRSHETAHALSRTPIVALSAFEIDEAMRQRVAVSMDDHLSKPVRKQDILRVLQRWAGLAPPDPA